MSYTPKPNTGTLWPNERKTAENHPDVRGDLFLDRAFVEALLKKNEPLVKIAVAGWNRTLGGKEAISMMASEPFVREARPEAKPAPDEDVPF